MFCFLVKGKRTPELSRKALLNLITNVFSFLFFFQAALGGSHGSPKRQASEGSSRAGRRAGGGGEAGLRGVIDCALARGRG